jgi:flagellar hook-length control protein FliK
MQKGEKKLVEFQLNPENLGKMEVKIEVVNKIVSASIKVENEAVQQMMQNSLDGLKSNLTQNGIQYNSVNVSLSNSDEKNQRYFKQKKRNNRATDISGLEATEETFTRKNLGYNNYDFIA